MRIQESSVQLSASHQALRSQTSETTLQVGFRRVLQGAKATTASEVDAEHQRVVKLLQGLVDAILAAIEGKKCPENLAASDQALPPKEATPAASREFTWQSQTIQTICESEQTTVCGKGQVQTTDGRQIDFHFAVDMARQFTSLAVNAESGQVVLQDPLVLSFDGKGAELAAQRMDFDLNADGQLESIPALAASSGFLVFDRNGNGKADNGSELFGAGSGNGFADLSALDADHNGWIDEADPAFSQLAVWSGSHFDSLTERGVGALYTAAVDAPFSLKNGSNQLLGQIRSAGIYLSEAGQVGQMQQVDLVVSAPAGGTEKPAESEHLPA